MIDPFEKLLLIKNDEDYSDINGVEYLFQTALEEGRLPEILKSFHHEIDVSEFIFKEVLNSYPLGTEWQTLLLNEVNCLIKLLPDSTIQLVEGVVEGVVDYDTEEMFSLRSMMGPVIRKASKASLTSHKRAFLNDFYYGIDFTHWTKWAVLFHYTNIVLRTPNIVTARYNGVNFSIKDQILVYSIN